MNFLYALDPATGKPIRAFGENGRLDMRKDLGSDYTQNTVALTTPGVLYNYLLILGFRAPISSPLNWDAILTTLDALRIAPTARQAK
jgi:quinoprotein glucose dehydrogenase